LPTWKECLGVGLDGRHVSDFMESNNLMKLTDFHKKTTEHNLP
jgi:hypothetical protein